MCMHIRCQASLSIYTQHLEPHSSSPYKFGENKDVSCDAFDSLTPYTREKKKKE